MRELVATPPSASERTHARGAAERILDLDAPRRTVRRYAVNPEVAADVHADAGHVVGELAGDDVGREPLPDPAGIEADTGGKSHEARDRIDLDPRRAQFAIVLGCATGDDLRVRAVVAGADHGAEDRRVEAPAREADAVERPLDERDRFG